ncbi:MAG: hypothetical protein JW920_03550 [Deltaproteobacteria bacterium]|nr:hypothetical protein [Deltaproteobacteria bacterium]
MGIDQTSDKAIGFTIFPYLRFFSHSRRARPGRYTDSRIVPILTLNAIIVSIIGMMLPELLDLI